MLLILETVISAEELIKKWGISFWTLNKYIQHKALHSYKLVTSIPQKDKIFYQVEPAWNIPEDEENLPAGDEEPLYLYEGYLFDCTEIEVIEEKLFKKTNTAQIIGEIPKPPKTSTAVVRKKHPAISAKKAAAYLGLKEREIRNWDKGIHRPEDYPGRENELDFHLFVNRRLSQKKTIEHARAMNEATSGGSLDDHAESAFDDL